MNHRTSRPLQAKQNLAVSQAVAKRLPHWDVDLQSVEFIGQLSLTVTEGETLRDLTIKVSTEPFSAQPRIIWSRRLIGRFTKSVIAEIGVAGRYVRIEAAQLALDEVDVLLPEPTAALPERALNDALTMFDGAWGAATGDKPVIAQSASDAQTFDVSHPAGSHYRVAFDLPGSDAGGRLFAWWNGSLVEAKGFAVSESCHRHVFDVVTTGAVDKLTFRGTSDSVLAENVAIDLNRQAQGDDIGVPEKAPAAPSMARAASGTIQGVLRRSIPDQAAARKAMALLGFGEGDEIIFR